MFYLNDNKINKMLHNPPHILACLIYLFGIKFLRVLIQSETLIETLRASFNINYDVTINGSVKWSVYFKRDARGRSIIIKIFGCIVIKGKNMSVRFFLFKWIIIR